MYQIVMSVLPPVIHKLRLFALTYGGGGLGRVVYKSRQPANFAGFSARFRRLLSLLHEPRYVEEMMFIRSKLLGLNK